MFTVEIITLYNIFIRVLLESNTVTLKESTDVIFLYDIRERSVLRDISQMETLIKQYRNRGIDIGISVFQVVSVGNEFCREL